MGYEVAGTLPASATGERLERRKREQERVGRGIDLVWFEEEISGERVIMGWRDRASGLGYHRGAMKDNAATCRAWIGGEDGKELARTKIRNELFKRLHGFEPWDFSKDFQD